MSELDVLRHIEGHLGTICDRLGDIVQPMERLADRLAPTHDEDAPDPDDAVGWNIIQRRENGQPQVVFWHESHTVVTRVLAVIEDYNRSSPDMGTRAWKEENR